MRNFFSFVFACLFVNGCYCSHTLGTDAGATPDTSFIGDGSAPSEDASWPADAGVPVLYVEVPEESPPAMTVLKGASRVPLLAIDFTAVGAEAFLEGMEIERTGVGATSDFENLYLFADDADVHVRLTPGRSLDPMTNHATFPLLSSPERIAVGETRRFWVYGDLSTSAMSGSQHTFGLVAVWGDTHVSAGPRLGGNTMTIAVVQARELTVQPDTLLMDPVSGERSIFSAFTAEGDFSIDSIALIQDGSIAASDLEDIEIGESGRLIGVGRVENDQIILRPDIDYRHLPWVTRTMHISAVVNSLPGRTIRTHIEYPVDVHAMDLEFGGTARVNVAAFNGIAPSTYTEVTVR